MLLTLNHLAPFHSPHQDLAALLAIEVGRRAALLVDEAGRIVAATPAACDLLRQSEEQLLGQHFGMWASSAEEVELDLIIPGGHRHSVLAQAHSRSQPGLVTILIERREPRAHGVGERDRKSTRRNSSH